MPVVYIGQLAKPRIIALCSNILGISRRIKIRRLNRPFGASAEESTGHDVIWNTFHTHTHTHTHTDKQINISHARFRGFPGGRQPPHVIGRVRRAAIANRVAPRKDLWRLRTDWERGRLKNHRRTWQCGWGWLELWYTKQIIVDVMAGGATTHNMRGGLAFVDILTRQ